MEKQTLNPLAKLWLWLGLFALATGGIYAVILVGARSPKVQDILPFGDFFRTALIVHVNLTVLVWMLSITAMLWNQYAKPRATSAHYTALITCAFGTFLMAISPFTSEGHPLLNNYVPILAQPVFLFALSLFFIGMALQVALAFVDINPNHKEADAVPFGLNCVAIIAAITIICFVLSAYGLRGSNLLPTDYYEHLFWAGGHTLQLAYTLVCLVAWLMMASHIGLKLHRKWLKLSLAITVLIAIFNPLIYGAWPPLSAEHQIFFTEQMRWGGGVSALLITMILLHSLTKSAFPKPTPVRNALIASFLLFGAGGVIALFISGANVIIPAHYHGSIVGVSLALMGVVYMYVPAQGKLALWQPYLYGGGQLLHIAGLAWSGGYGTLRKTPGAAQTIEGQTAMGLMGFGGLLSIIGGLVFVIIIWRNLRKGK